MKLLLDDEGKINYDSITPDTTVQELLDAIDIFLEGHRLPCGSCEDSCCKKSWAVEMDNVCVNRLCGWDGAAAGGFIRDKLSLKVNYFRRFRQYVLKKDIDCSYITPDNLCNIYEQRPIICRLFICSEKSYRYNMIRELIGGTYLKALVIEERIRRGNYAHRTINRYRRNPAVFAKGYDALLYDIIGYAKGEGWVGPEDERELCQSLKPVTS
jgi:Fe-S-cluster containining protein